MKLLNYSVEHLIEQNMRKPVMVYPDSYTKSQYRILCKLIIRHKIEKKFFDYLLFELYGLEDWKQLNYRQMYNLIHILTYWNYGKGRTNK